MQATKQRERCGTVMAASILRCHPQTIQKQLKLDPDFPKSVSGLWKDEYYVDDIEAYRDLRIKRKEQALEKRRKEHLKQQQRQHRRQQLRQRVAM